MATEHLREILRELHRELKEQSGSLDERSEALLRTVTADIQSVLDRPRAEAPPADEHHSMMERLNEAVHHFEDSHPALTSLVGRLLDILGRTIP